jgi:hypothetical protein
MVAVAGTIRAKGLNPKGQPWAIAIEEPLPDQRAVHRIVPVSDEESRSLRATGRLRVAGSPPFPVTAWRPIEIGAAPNRASNRRWHWVGRHPMQQVDLAVSGLHRPLELLVVEHRDIGHEHGQVIALSDQCVEVIEQLGHSVRRQNDL